MKKTWLLILPLLLTSCVSSNSSDTSSLGVSSGTSFSSPSSLPSTSSSSSSSSFSSSLEDKTPYSFTNSNVSISSYEETDKEYQVNGKTLVFNNCMKANKKWSALQMQKSGGEIYNKTPMNYNHVVVSLRDDSTSQYASGENLSLYFGETLKPVVSHLSSDRVSSTENGVPIFTLTFSLDKTYSYWRLFNDSTNAAYFLSAQFSLE